MGFSFQGVLSIQEAFDSSMLVRETMFPRRRRIFAALNTAIAVCMVSLLARDFRFMWPLILLLPLIIAWPFWVSCLQARRIKRKKLELLESSVDFSADYVSVINRLSNLKLGWVHIQPPIITEKGIQFMSGKQGFIYLPNRVFSDEKNRNEFIAFILQCRASAKIKFPRP